MSTDDFDTRFKTQLCTRKEAFAIINKSKGKTLFVRGATFLETSRDGDVRRGFDDQSANIMVSKPAARKYVEDILTVGFEARGARIKIVSSIEDALHYSGCIFIG